MTTIEFLKAELKDCEDSFQRIAINFNDIVNKACASGMRDNDANILVEAVKRTLKEKRDFLRELIAKAEKVAQ